MLVRAICVIFGLSFTTACKEEPPPPAPPPSRAVRVPAPGLPELMLVVRRSEVVAAVEVVSVEASTRRTGGPCNEQEVTYAVVKPLVGATASGRVVVSHPVCVDRPFVDHRTVALSPEHVRPGAPFILFLRRAGEAYGFADDHFGILPDSPGVRADVERAIANVAGSKGPGKGDPFNK